MSKQTPIHLFARFFIIVFALTAYGCSSSNSELGQSNSTDTAHSTITNTNPSVIPGEHSEATQLASTPPDPTQDDYADPQQEPVEMVTVQFDITVPEFQSNELQLQVLWGNKSTNADWVADELWRARLDLPANETNALKVHFFDRYGAVVLASYSAQLSTGIEILQQYPIAADRFDTTLWDDDADGTPNFNELLAGTDPLYNEYANAEIIEEVSIIFEVNNWEGRINQERPFEQTIEETPAVPANGPPLGQTRTLNIAIDAFGNGTLSEYQRCCSPSGHYTTTEATRAVTEDSLLWEGTVNYYEPEYAHSKNTEFQHQVSAMTGERYHYIGNVRLTSAASYRETTVTNVDIVTQRTLDETVCEPIYGTYQYQRTGSTWNPATENITVTVSRLQDDLYWKVRTAYIDVTTDIETVEYQLARAISSSLDCAFLEL